MFFTCKICGVLADDGVPSECCCSFCMDILSDDTFRWALKRGYLVIHSDSCKNIDIDV